MKKWLAALSWVVLCLLPMATMAQLPGWTVPLLHWLKPVHFWRVDLEKNAVSRKIVTRRKALAKQITTETICRIRGISCVYTSLPSA